MDRANVGNATSASTPDGIVGNATLGIVAALWFNATVECCDVRESFALAIERDPQIPQFAPQVSDQKRLTSISYLRSAYPIWRGVNPKTRAAFACTQPERSIASISR